MNYFDLKGQVALVTGCSGGLGVQMAKALASQGCNIVAIARRMDKLEAVCAEIEKEFGVETLPLQCDITDTDNVNDVVAKAVAKFGRIDILINNAGICAYAFADEMLESEWDATMDINAKGAWLTAKYVIPVMKSQVKNYVKGETYGVIINNSSIGGLRGMRRLSHYAASKWAMTGMTKSWALELAPWGIRCISIHPTGVNTPLNDGIAAMEGKTPEEVAEASAGNLIPVPWIESEDVANSVLFLCSDKAKYVTGSQYVLDAGLLTV